MAEKKSKFVPHSHIPYGRDGSGFYSDHHAICYHANNAAIPLVVDAVQSTVIKPGSVFTIVDYGTADGGTSMPLMYACVKAIREKYGQELPINIIYEDQPVNDFKSVFMRLQGLIPGPPSYLVDFTNVFVLASGTNYYDQCFPSNSVNLGFSGTSMHWLSKKPCDLSHTLYWSFTMVPEENDKFREQAARDWERILLNRAAELAPGAKMVFAIHSVDQQWRCDELLSNFRMFDVLSNLWKGMVDDGFIIEKESKNTNIIAYHRTAEEFQKPFKHTDSPVNQAGLQLVSIETRMIPCPFRERWMKEKGDPKEHAKRFVSSIRAWCYSTFMSGLSDTRSDQEKAHIVDELFHRYEAEVARHPDDYGDDWFYVYLTVQKRTDVDE